MILQPILIAAPPRSGTTMLAGLLSFHGVWVGRAKTTHYPGSNSEFGSENMDIKRIMKREAASLNYKNWRKDMPEDTYMDHITLKQEIENFVPQDIRWLVKTSWTLTFYKFWMNVYPEALWVLLYRSKEKILNSMNRHDGMRRHPDAMKKEFIQVLHERQSMIHAQADMSEYFDVEKIVKKDINEINRLFTFLNMEPRWNLIGSWIEPNMMKI